jgi:predicted 3-demethylubiquinone-9 3-methyltransferase (glyoxalase superfamily)
VIARNTICLWYERDALEAARFYAATFADSAVGRVMQAPADYPSGKEGDVLTVEFTVLGIPCLGLNGGPAFRQDEAFSFQSPPTTRPKPTATGTRSSATAARKARAAGARTAGGCPGRSRRVS